LYGSGPRVSPSFQPIGTWIPRLDLRVRDWELDFRWQNVRWGQDVVLHDGEREFHFDEQDVLFDRRALRPALLVGESRFRL
jgi:hypothetical protein